MALEDVMDRIERTRQQAEDWDAAMADLKRERDPAYQAECRAEDEARRKWSSLPPSRAADGTRTSHMTAEQIFQADREEGRI
jgi:hypothetical protein